MRDTVENMATPQQKGTTVHFGKVVQPMKTTTTTKPTLHTQTTSKPNMETVIVHWTIKLSVSHPPHQYDRKRTQTQSLLPSARQLMKRRICQPDGQHSTSQKVNIGAVKRNTKMIWTVRPVQSLKRSRSHMKGHLEHTRMKF